MNRAIFFFLLVGRFAAAQDLPISRRLLINTQAFLDKAEARTAPLAIAGDKSRVLVLFRLAERGTVIDSRASGGSEAARTAALNAVKEWRFKPTTVAGRAIQMHSAALFDFSVTPVQVQAPPPMSGEQLSPVLRTRCSIAIMERKPDTVTVCRDEMRAVESNRSRTPMEALTVHDELGVALLEFGDDVKTALSEIDRAIELAAGRLDPSDAEWGYLHWHRGEAKRKLGQTGDAGKDFAIAEKSLRTAAEAIEGPGSAAYRDLLAKLVKHHAAMLSAAGQAEEAGF